MDQSQEARSIAVGQETACEEDPAATLEAEVDHAIALCDGDARAALRALLLLVRHLEEEAQRFSAAVSRGYVRGDLYHPLLRADRLADGHSGER